MANTTCFYSILLFIAATVQLSLAYAPLAGITARSVKTSQDIDLSEFVSTPSSNGKKSMLVLGTYAADFNAIEYAQRLRYYMVCIACIICMIMYYSQYMCVR